MESRIKKYKAIYIVGAALLLSSILYMFITALSNQEVGDVYLFLYISGAIIMYTAAVLMRREKTKGLDGSLLMPSQRTAMILFIVLSILLALKFVYNLLN